MYTAIRKHETTLMQHCNNATFSEQRTQRLHKLRLACPHSEAGDIGIHRDVEAVPSVEVLHHVPEGLAVGAVLVDAEVHQVHMYHLVYDYVLQL